MFGAHTTTPYVTWWNENKTAVFSQLLIKAETGQIPPSTLPAHRIVQCEIFTNIEPHSTTGGATRALCLRRPVG